MNEQQKISALIKKYSLYNECGTPLVGFNGVANIIDEVKADCIASLTNNEVAQLAHKRGISEALFTFGYMDGVERDQDCEVDASQAYSDFLDCAGDA